MGDTGIKSGTLTYFALVTQDSGFDHFDADGLLGLGFSGLSDNNPTFIQSLKSAGNITVASFSMYLNNLGPFGKHDGYGTPASNMQIGTYNLTKYSTSLVFTASIPVTSDPGYWQATVQGISIGTYSLGALSVIFDSGTSLIAADSISFSNIYNYLSGVYTCQTDGNFIECDCSGGPASMSGLVVLIGTVPLPVPSSRLWLEQDGQCLLLIENGGGDFWILGDVFLQNYYTNYNMDTLIVSFAPAVNANWSSADKIAYGVLVGLVSLIF